MPPRLAIIADDFTGLQAIAGEFRRFGLSVATAMDTEAVAGIVNAEIIGIDTDSRGLTEQEAIEATSCAATRLRALGAPLIYKQSDSGLQGHIAAESRAIAAAFGATEIIYAPSCPVMGRITRNGRQVEADPSGQGLKLDIEIAPLWAGAPLRVVEAYQAGLFEGSTAQTTIVNAERDRALARLAKRCLNAPKGNLPLLVGSVGFATAIALALNEFRSAAHARPVLIIAGSLQQQTRRQLRMLDAVAGCTIITLPHSLAQAGAVEATLAEAIASLARGSHCVLAAPDAESLPENARYPFLDEKAHAERNACLMHIVSALVSRQRSALGGVIVAGGTTSELIARLTFGIRTTEIAEWLSPGVTAAIATDGAGTTLPLVTKAGTWGSDDVLLRAILWIQNHHHERAEQPRRLAK